MDTKFFSHIQDPISAKLLLTLYEQKRATTAELSKKLCDIPQATLYRRLKRMLEDGLLKVVEENRIRGTMERVYALNYDIDSSWTNMSETNDGRLLQQFITHSLLGILKEFEEYAAKENIDIKRDGIGFFTAPVYATLEELKSTLDKVTETLNELKENKPEGQRRLRNICIAVTPPKDYCSAD